MGIPDHHQIMLGSSTKHSHDSLNMLFIQLTEIPIGNTDI